MSTIRVMVYHGINNRLKRFPGFYSVITKLRLSISNQEILLRKIIGIDIIRKKLVIVRKKSTKSLCCIIDLDEVKTCTVKKIYGSISAGSLKMKKLDDYLHSISLQLGFRNGKEPVILKFYDNIYNKPYELPALEVKAKKWERIVSSLMNTERA